MIKYFLSVLCSLILISQNADGAKTFSRLSAEVKILVPPAGEEAYKIAGDIFVDFWEKVTGYRPVIHQINDDETSLPGGDIVLIGSDAVNPLVHQLIRSGEIEDINIQYGSDNYRIFSLKTGNTNCLILAGGNGRSTIYAVYDFFRKQAGVEYFWDGDVIPRQEQIGISGIDISEKPHFRYRGLRYFAHRGLHRFQAEHWDLDDWKREIDWLMKERFNLFMLRTGIDDLFQRAFPEDVSYPPVDKQDTDAKQRSYDDRTSFWPLKYRGELRKQVLQYARERGLIHPEDIGTITHWYSHTPGSFYENKPGFPVITNQKSGYSLPTQAIWDIEKQEAWDAYWNLTETHIREFGGGSPRMFHTIGMAERVFGQSDRENLQSKLYVYRKTEQRLRENYPDAPLLIASWDFIGWQWTDKGVQNLIKEFDPEKTILLDYTADKNDKVTYRDWDVYKKFPWIFGIFHGFAKNSDIHEDYKILTPRLQEVIDDEKCVGLVAWSEISHSDTYMLEYLAENSWDPSNIEIEKATGLYCKNRYAKEIGQEMKFIWGSFLNSSQTLHWSRGGIPVGEPQFRTLTSGAFINLTPEHLDKLSSDYRKTLEGLQGIPEALERLSDLAVSNYEDQMWRRDAIDIARTVANRAIFATLTRSSVKMEEWRHKKADRSEIVKLSNLSKEMLACLSRLLAMSDDYSMNATLKKLYDAKTLNGVPPFVNPHSEQTLKGNSENGYCRSHHYELVEYVYRPETEVFWNYVLKRIKSGDRSEWKRPQEFAEQKKIIEDRFYDKPLIEMAPAEVRTPERLAEIIKELGELVKQFINS